MKKMKILMYILISVVISSSILLSVIGKKVNPIIYKYSNLEAKRFGIYVINYSLNKEFVNSLNEDLFEVVKTNDGEIQMIDFKTKEVNKELEKITEKIQKNLIDLENGKIDEIVIADTFKGLRFKDIKKGVVCELPMGVLLSNALFSNSGPVIPIKFNFIGQVSTNLETKIKNYGINNAYIEVNIHIKLNEVITMPMQTKKINVETDVPIAMKIIQGNLPIYYQSDLQRDSSIFSLPIG